MRVKCIDFGQEIEIPDRGRVDIDFWLGRISIVDFGGNIVQNLKFKGEVGHGLQEIPDGSSSAGER